MNRVVSVISFSVGILLLAVSAFAQSEWEKTLAAARKEGTLVVGIPASVELRKALESTFPATFNIPLELTPSRGPENANRIISEHTAGVRYFDLFISGGATPLTVVAAGAADEMLPYMMLPDVRDPKNWWGGHIWEDNVSTHKFLYSFLADVATHGIWYNTSLAKADELKSFDDYLNPKWKGKIGFSDPRVPSSGQSLWSFMWDLKGEEFLKKLVQQELFLTRDLRQLADALAKGKVAIAFGLGRSQTDPFVDAGLPLKSVPAPKEGLPASNSFGVI
ncbi:MAG TPA: extracellular solute-binding protein, partial [Candidatus Binatia bacterium]|nr:extracellular solute-binding protein [Candidatus Binatia bacterium]